MKILVAGDYYPALHIEPSVYKDLLGQFGSDIDLKDTYKIVNYESPVANDSDKPIQKCGPHLKSQLIDVENVKRMGFDAVTLANNHTLDYGSTALLNTIKLCKDNGLDVVGAGKNLDDAGKILYKKFVDETIAIINCCEHEFSIASEDSPGTNPLNPMRQWYSITEARENADYVLVIVHGGHEHFQLPSPRMQETYRFFVDAGADAVVNHHQHCYSGYEIYNGKPIFYGLGNFIFPEPNSSKIWNEGFLLQLDFQKDSIDYKIAPYVQEDSLGVKPMDEVQRSEFKTTLLKLCETISDPEILKKEHESWMNKTSISTKLTFEPFNNRYLNALYRRGYMPSLLKRNKLLAMLNSIDCEAHRDRVIAMLKSEINN